MPVVPIEQNRVGIAEVDASKLRAPDLSGTGLEAVGRGLQAVGNGASEFAVAHAEIQNHANKLYARNGELDNKAKKKKIVNDFQSLLGKNALDVAASTQTQLDELDKETLAHAGNKQSRAYLETMLAESRPDFINQIADHARKQQFVFSHDTYSTEANTAASDAGSNFADPARQAKAFAESDAAVERLAYLTGESKEVTADKKLKLHDGAHADALTTMLATNRLDDALAYYGKNKGEMTLDGRNKFLATVQSPLEKREDNADFADLSSGATATVGDRQKVTIPAGTYHLPVSGTVTNTYAQHQARHSAGMDIGAPVGSGIHPIAGGTVIEVHPVNDGKSGMFVGVKHPDGHVSTYAHMGNISVKKGDPVAEGTVLGTVGVTGHTTGPHVHLRVRDAQGHDVDPQSLMGHASPTGTVVGSTEAPRNWDQGAIMAKIDARADWTPEKKDRMRSVAHQRMQQDESLLTDQYQDAEARALDVVVKLGDGFTSLSQIPTKGMSSASLEHFQNMAKANAKPTPPPANGDDVVALHRMSQMDRGKFATINLAKYQPFMTAAEYDEISKDQASAIGEAKNTKVGDIRVKIDASIKRAEDWEGVKLNGPTDSPTDGFRVRRYMQLRADEESSGGRVLADADFARYFRDAIRKQDSGGLFGGKDSAYKFLSPNMRAVIERALARNGVKPSDDEVQKYWTRMGEPTK